MTTTDTRQASREATSSVDPLAGANTPTGHARHDTQANVAGGGTHPFDLRAIVRAVLDETALADPGDIADEVERRIPRNRKIDALRICLRNYCRNVSGFERRIPTMDDEDDPRPQSTTPVTSAKVAAIREAEWQRKLRGRIYGGQQWKTLAECTRDDLLYLVQDRRDQASRLGYAADGFEHLTKLLDEHGVDHVGDLPDSVLADALSSGDLS